MHELERRGNWRAGIVQQLTSMRERLIGTVLLGNNVVNIAASALATSVLLEIFGDAGVVYATIGMTLLVLIFGEVLPKTYAIISSLTGWPCWSTPRAHARDRVRPDRHDGRICGQAHPLAVRCRHQQGRTMCSPPMMSCGGRSRSIIAKAAVVKKDRVMLGGILDLQVFDGERRHGPPHQDR